MIKRLFFILIAAIAILGLKSINHSSIHNKGKVVAINQSHLLSNLSLNTVNTFSFINEIEEDDLNEDKFHASLNYFYITNFCKRKFQFKNLKLGLINSRVYYTNLFKGVSFYTAIGSYRI